MQKGRHMKTKKVVITLYGENHIHYGGDVVVEAPQGMNDEDIRGIIASNSHRIPVPKWREVDEWGFSVSDDSPDIVGVADSDQEPSVRLTEDKDGDIRIFIRKKHDG